MRIADSVRHTIGNTPLIELGKVEDHLGNSIRVLGKVEAFNPGGSAKDRPVLSMIEEAEKAGLLKAGASLVEPTSGNTGAALAAIGASKGYSVVLTMPETMSLERRQILKAYGASLVLTDGAKGMKGAIEKAQEIVEQTPGAFMPSQFTNPANPKAHFETTGPEIWEATDGKVDIFVAGIGTGGTITGVGEYLKSRNPQIQIIGVEPYASQVLSGGKAGPHGIQGIGAGFVPDILNMEIIDEIIPVTEEEAYANGRFLAEEEGLLVGISSGAALAAALVVGKRLENKGRLIVVLLPDTGERYLSTLLFNE